MQSLSRIRAARIPRPHGTRNDTLLKHVPFRSSGRKLINVVHPAAALKNHVTAYFRSVLLSRARQTIARGDNLPVGVVQLHFFGVSAECIPGLRILIDYKNVEIKIARIFPFPRREDQFAAKMVPSQTLETASGD